MRRVATTTRGGYCFQLNGAFARTLDALGYNVSRHVAGVRDRVDASIMTLTNHIALIVVGLCGEGNDDGRWYVDVGLGNVLHEPLPLASGASVQGPTRFTMERTTKGWVGDWHVGHQTAGSSAGVSIVAAAFDVAVFTQRHVFNATPRSRALPARSHVNDATSTDRTDCGAGC